VAAHLENRPSRRFRSIVREAQKKYLHDKDFCVVDHVRCTLALTTPPT
jgi:RNase P protein component